MALSKLRQNIYRRETIMGKRTWVKLYCDKWLDSSLRQESPAVRGVFADLLALCGGGNYSEEGCIKIRNRVGFNNLQLEKLLNLTPQMWGKCKMRLIKTDRIEVADDNILTIKNWGKYQSEYERQKPQRTKSAGESAGESAGDSKVESAGIDYRYKTIDIYSVFKYWNFLKIKTHKKLTDGIKQRIQSRLKDYSIDEIERMMFNYAEVLNNPQCELMNYRWTLETFLTGTDRLEKFSDLAVAIQNYTKNKPDSNSTKSGRKVGKDWAVR